MRPFLTAAWRNLLMLNFEADPAVLRPYVPAHAELDTWNNTCYSHRHAGQSAYHSRQRRAIHH